jgi:hypothetical protein
MQHNTCSNTRVTEVVIVLSNKTCLFVTHAHRTEKHCRPKRGLCNGHFSGSTGLQLYNSAYLYGNTSNDKGKGKVAPKYHAIKTYWGVEV